VWRRVEFWPFLLTCFVAFKTLSHYRARVYVTVNAAFFNLFSPTDFARETPNISARLQSENSRLFTCSSLLCEDITHCCRKVDIATVFAFQFVTSTGTDVMCCLIQEYLIPTCNAFSAIKFYGAPKCEFHYRLLII